MNNTGDKVQRLRRRVVITGMGAVTPIGLNVAETWQALLDNRCGISPIESFDVTDYKVSLAAEIKNYKATDYFDRKEARRLDRYTQFALVAAREAVAQAGLDHSDAYEPERIGVVFGSGIGGINTFEEEVLKLDKSGPGRVSPIFIPKMISNIAPGYIAMDYNFRGDNFTISSACASSAHAIGEAFRKIADGYLDACVTGGTEAAVSPVAIAGFSNMTALSKETDPTKACLPFDARRGGFVLGEGGGILVLEALDTARARGAEILGEIVGYGASSDAYHITSPAPDGVSAAKAMKLAMAEAGISPAEVDYINAHATGTPLNDKYETGAIKLALGETDARRVAINSTKSMTGHLLGGAGGLEAIVTCLSIKHGQIHRTIGYQEPDPECDLDYTTSANRKLDIRYALTNSLGFGGHNATLCLTKYEE